MEIIIFQLKVDSTIEKMAIKKKRNKILNKIISLVFIEWNYPCNFCF